MHLSGESRKPVFRLKENLNEHRHHSARTPTAAGRRNRHGHHDHYDANNNGHQHNDAGDGHDANNSPSTRSASSRNGTWLLLP